MCPCCFSTLITCKADGSIVCLKCDYVIAPVKDTSKSKEDGNTNDD